MMMAPAGVMVHLALGVTDMRKGIDGLAMVVQPIPLSDIPTADGEVAGLFHG